MAWAAPGARIERPASGVPPAERRQAAGGRGLLLVALFAFIAGVGAIVVALLLDRAPLPPGDGPAGANRAAAEEFYAAQDAALATGDTRRLMAALDPAFDDHRPGSAGRGRGGLVDEIAALRNVQPATRLTVEALVVEGDRVLAYVSRRPLAAANPRDATRRAADVSADTVELVRIAGGVVAERWSVDPLPGTWPATIVTPTTIPIWSTTRFATATAAGQACLASACH